MSAALGRHIEIRGVVQGVGFRPWVYRLATEEGLAGRVRNDATGVTIDAFGSEHAIDAFLRRLEDSPPPAAVIGEVRSWAIPVEPIDGFSIVHSEESSERRVSIPPDLATCTECASEIVDPTNRRYHYPFTNCTNCGPRFTITRDVPYDRPATTMAAFRMCPECQREYENVRDRRFHAQPNACPECGPWLQLMAPDGVLIVVDDSIAAVATAWSTARSWRSKGSAASISPATPRLRKRSSCCARANIGMRNHWR